MKFCSMSDTERNIHSLGRRKKKKKKKKAWPIVALALG